MKLVFDASPIIAFFKESDGSDIPNVLSENGYELLIPAGVVSEIKKEPERSAVVAALESGRFGGCVVKNPQHVNALKLRYPGLGQGEVEVLMTTEELIEEDVPVTCVLDDKVARNVAKRLELPIIGTIGLLKKIADEELIDNDRCLSLISQLDNSTFRANRKICITRRLSM